MENQTDSKSDPSAETHSETAADKRARLTEDFKARAQLARERLGQAQAVAREKLALGSLALRGGFDRAVGAVRNGLDLPSRREMTNLAARVEELDQKLGQYETQQGARAKRKSTDATA